MTPRRAAALLLALTVGVGCSDGGGDARGADALDAAPAGGLTIELPASVPVGRRFPVVVRTADGAPVDGEVALTVGAARPIDLVLRRGRGSASVMVPVAGEVSVEARLGARAGTARLTAGPVPSRAVRGVLAGADLTWAAGEEILLDADVVVPAGATLSIAPGVRVVAGPRVNVDVEGALDAQGSRERPVLFLPADAPWGGITFREGTRGTLRHVMLTGGGGDDRRPFAHSSSQPVVFALPGSEVTVEGGGIVDAPGKAYSSVGATLTIRDVLVSRCDQGGEHHDSALLVEGGHWLEIPDADGKLADDDNDGMYLSSGMTGVAGTRPMVVRDTVVAVVEDDGIDHGGALLTLERVWIERAHNEGVAAANGGRVDVVDSVVIGARQGIEAGWGAPTVVVEHTSILDCDVGLRWGDEYPTRSEGTLTARYVAIGGRTSTAVRSLWTGADPPISDPAALTVSCSLLSDPWAGTNVVGKAAFDARGCVSPPHASVPGCPAGPVGPRCP